MASPPCAMAVGVSVSSSPTLSLEGAPGAEAEDIEGWSSIEGLVFRILVLLILFVLLLLLLRHCLLELGR